MSVVVVGVNHRTVPVGLLERMAVAPAMLPKALHALSEKEHLAEAVLLSTCNRTEVYARYTTFHPAVQDALDFLTQQSAVHLDDLSDHLYTYHDDAAVAHLFGVAAGVDSMIVGEAEILGQVRESWLAAERERTSGAVLSRMFRQAIEVGKRSRTETAIGRNPASVSSAAVAVAAERLGSLEGRRVLVLGAGGVSAGLAVALAGAGVGEIVVANRTPEHAEALARRVEGRPVPLDDVAAELDRADVLLASTAADSVLLERSEVEAVMQRRDGRALLVVDVAVPRDVDPGVGQVFGVTLLDIDDLKAYAEQSLQQRRQEVGKVREIISHELERYRMEHSAREVAPLVSALHARGEAVRATELERYRSRLDRLDPSAREAIEALTRGIVNKLLHEPTVRVKGAAGTARGELYADALAELFDITGPAAPPDG
jgi:glutamyl-tRNA reductase